MKLLIGILLILLVSCQPPKNNGRYCLNSEFESAGIFVGEPLSYTWEKTILKDNLAEVCELTFKFIKNTIATNDSMNYNSMDIDIPLLWVTGSFNYVIINGRLNFYNYSIDISIAYELNQMGSYRVALYLPKNGIKHICINKNCNSSCGFDVRNGQIIGCDCKGNGWCQHIITTNNLW